MPSLPALPANVTRIVQFLVLLGLVALLWHAADGAAALDLLQTASPSWLILAVVLLTLQTLLSAQRWRVTAAQLGLSLPLGDAIREYYLAQVVNQSLPGGVVGDAGRAVRARKAAGLLISSQAVIFERVAGQIGLFCVLGIGFALTLVVPVGFDWPVWVIGPLATTFAILIALPFAVAGAMRLIPSETHPIKTTVRSFVRAVAGRGVLGQQIALSLATALCNIAAFACCAAAIGVPLPLLVVATLVPLILFAMVIPLSISGWGLREGAAVLLFPVIGATATEGLAASVAFGIAFMLTVLPGLILTWLRPLAPVPEQP